MDVVHIFTAWSELLAFLAREREVHSYNDNFNQPGVGEAKIRC